MEDSKMLVLTRRTEEKIRINEEIEITVLSIKGDRVRLGIKAPHGVPVHREEVHQRIVAENAT
jgi:carbon storage regulator